MTLPGKGDDLIDRLPHTDPFRFITAVSEIEPGESGAGEWRVTGDEAFFVGHFPGNPIVPGVLITEALAQMSGVVGFESNGEPVAGMLVHNDIRFRNSVAPPAMIRLTSRVTRTFGALIQFDVSAHHNDRLVARGSLTLAKTE